MAPIFSKGDHICRCYGGRMGNLEITLPSNKGGDSYECDNGTRARHCPERATVGARVRTKG